MTQRAIRAAARPVAKAKGAGRDAGARGSVEPGVFLFFERQKVCIGELQGSTVCSCSAARF